MPQNRETLICHAYCNIIYRDYLGYMMTMYGRVTLDYTVICDNCRIIMLHDSLSQTNNPLTRFQLSGNVLGTLFNVLARFS